MSELPAEPVVQVRPTGWGALRALGPDAREWLNGLVTCDVEQVLGEQGAWGLLLNKRGKIVCDLTLLGDGDGVFIGTGHDTGELLELLDSYLVMEDVELSSETDHTWLTLHGPGALLLARELQALAFGRVAYGAEESAALVVKRAEAEQSLERLQREFGAHVLDDATWLSYRVRHGLPAFGVDFGTEDNPHEAGLDRRTVSWSKGCYLGQEVVCMQDMRGKLKRRLVRLALRETASVEPGSAVVDEAGAQVGSVTSVDPVPLATAGAIARLKAPYFQPGARVSVAGAPATVLELLDQPDQNT